MRKISRLPEVSNEMRIRSRELRKSMTDSERKIWKYLRSKQLGTKFHRQRVIGPYICDFVSLDHGIIIEIDGGQHFTDEIKVNDQNRISKVSWV